MNIKKAFLVFIRKGKIIKTIFLFLLILAGIFFILKASTLISREGKVVIKDNKNKDLNKDEKVSVKESSNESFSEQQVREEEKESDKEEIKKESFPKIIEKRVGTGYAASSGRNIDTVVIHTSYNALGGDKYDVDKLILEYKKYGVSPHYLINRSGDIYRLVEDKNIAYHAGKSQAPDGRSNVNNFSLGIELMNSQEDKLSSAQYDSLKLLLKYIKERYNIKYILGHKDIAKGRKDDPWNFNWNELE